MNVAGRFENYDDFGSNLSGKLATRYKLLPGFSIRASINNGFHAPALQQIYYSAVFPGFKNVGGINIPVRVETFRNNHDITIAFGVKPLKPEKAINLSSGFAFTLSRQISLTVDAYWIQIKNRIVLSGIFDKTNNPDVQNILQNRTDIDQVQFMTNAINTKTRGIDMVLNGSWHIRRSIISLTLAANFNRTNVFGPIQTTEKLSVNPQNRNTLFNREEEEKIERGQPRSKTILQLSYKMQNLELLVRNTRFGKTSAVFSSALDSLDEFFSPKILTDASISYSLKKWLVIIMGANNILDVYPDPLKKFSNKNQGILIYSNEAMPFGYNGGYYYVSMNFRL